MSFFSFSEQFTGTLFQAQDGSFWVGIKKALSKTLGAKDHGGGPKLRATLNAVDRGPGLVEALYQYLDCDCKSLDRGCLINLVQFVGFIHEITPLNAISAAKVKGPESLPRRDSRDQIELGRWRSVALHQHRGKRL